LNEFSGHSFAGNRTLPFQNPLCFQGKSQENPWKKISQKISRKFTTGPENPYKNSKKIPEIWSLEIPQKVPEKSQECPHITALFFSKSDRVGDFH